VSGPGLPPARHSRAARRGWSHRGNDGVLLMIVALVVFLGVHSVRILAEDWRTRQIERIRRTGRRLVSEVVISVRECLKAILFQAYCTYGLGRFRLFSLGLY
jgi:hypothetical protein